MNEIPLSPIISIVPSEPWHVGELRKNLRTEDADEMLKLGADIQHVMWITYRRALIRKTAFVNGNIAAFWGCHGTFLGEVGIPFLMTTPEVHNVSPLKFARVYQSEVYSMLKMFNKLENWVDASYTASVRLLEIIGFELDDPEPKGRNNELYIRFKIRA